MYFFLIKVFLLKSKNEIDNLNEENDEEEFLEELINRHMKRSHIEDGLGHFLDYKFKKRDLTVSYIDKKIDRLYYQRAFAHNLEIYERFYLVSDWKKIGKSKKSKNTSKKKEKKEINPIHLGDSNIEIFEKMYGESHIKSEEANNGPKFEEEFNMNSFKLIRPVPKVDSKNADFEIYDYYRNVAHIENIKYLTSLLES